MKSLGLYFGACASAAISDNGKIIFASSEERFSRIKSDETFPTQTIDNALSFCNMTSQDLDKVLVAGTQIPLLSQLVRNWSSFSVKDHYISMEKFWRPKLNGEPHPKFMELFNSKIRNDKFPFNKEISGIDKFDYDDFSNNSVEYLTNVIKKSIMEYLNIGEEKILFLDHHSCHAAYGLYSSPIRDDNTLIFTADAHGDGLSGTISKYDQLEKKIERLKFYPTKDFQLGRMYRYTTLLLGMLPEHHEYKVMGLAPYYDGPVVKDVEKIYQDMQSLSGLDFKFNSEIKNIFDYLEEHLDTFRFDHIAAGLQSFTENILYEWMDNAVNHFDSTSVVFSGGISMNVKANMKLSNIPKIKKFFVPGGGGDLSLCMGSCYLFSESKDEIPQSLENLYLGLPCKYTANDLSKINSHKIHEYTSEDQIVQRLLDGKIIATCLGRSEMGPRALCNRSIIADPRNRDNIQKINRKIKNRDFWMPFAPVIIDKYQNELISNPKNLEMPHMTIAMETHDGQKNMPAAVHQYDETARPLILTKNTNQKVWNVINLFYKKTGIPALVNTSFNLHGEPIVDSFNDALHVFNNSGLDTLWLDNHVIDK